MVSIDKLIGNVSVGNILEEMYSFEKDESFKGIVEFNEPETFFFVLFHLIETYQKKLHPNFIDSNKNQIHLSEIKKYLQDNSDDFEQELISHVHQWFENQTFAKEVEEQLNWIDEVSLKHLGYDYRSSRELDTLLKLLALTMDTEGPSPSS